MTSSTASRLFVTGATGQLGSLVIDALLRYVPAARIVAGVRDPGSDAAKALSANGIELRIADYARPETLGPALAGIGRLLLISSNDLGGRLVQHGNVIAAAKAASVSLLAYTSLLHAPTSPFGIAEEHRQTEAALAASGVPFVLLRNGWYNENYAASIPIALAHGALIGSAADGLIASAARADYALAAAIVLTSKDQAGRIYELAGDTAYTLTELAAEAQHLTGKPLIYRNLPVADYKAALLGAGVPEMMAGLFADFHVGTATGTLLNKDRQLSQLIGRPTTPVSETLKQMNL